VLGVEPLVQLEEVALVLLDVALGLLVPARQAGGGVGVDVGHAKAAVMDLGAEKIPEFFRGHGRSVLAELYGYDAEVEQLVASQHGQWKGRPDLGLDHQPLEVAGLAHADAADRDDHVARAQLAARGG